MLRRWTRAVEGMEGGVDTSTLSRAEILNLAEVLLGDSAHKMLEFQLHQVTGWQQFLDLVDKTFGLDRETRVTQFYD